VAIPLVLSGGHAAIVPAHWSSGQGGFDSLESVENLFESRWLLLAGWVHYLAFDLLVGAWQLRTARRERIAHQLLLPCLPATFLFGPAGHLLFQLLRAAHRTGAGRPATGPTSPAPDPFALARLAADSPRHTRLAIRLALAMLPLLGALALDARRFRGNGVWIKPLKFHAALVVYKLTLAFFARFASPEPRRPLGSPTSGDTRCRFPTSSSATCTWRHRRSSAPSSTPARCAPTTPSRPSSSGACSR